MIASGITIMMGNIRPNLLIFLVFIAFLRCVLNEIFSFLNALNAPNAEPNAIIAFRTSSTAALSSIVLLSTISFPSTPDYRS